MVLTHLTMHGLFFSLSWVIIPSSQKVKKHTNLASAVPVIHHQSDTAIGSFLFDQQRLIEYVTTWWNLHFLEGCRLALLSPHQCRHPVDVSDARLGALELDRNAVHVPSCLYARVAHGLVDAVTSSTFNLTPTDVNLVCCRVKTDRHLLGWQWGRKCRHKRANIRG